MATPAQFYDQNGELRLDGTLVGGGGSLPAGGTTGEVLTKASNADGDADWEAAGGGFVTESGYYSGTQAAAGTRPPWDILGAGDDVLDRTNPLQPVARKDGLFTISAEIVVLDATTPCQATLIFDYGNDGANTSALGIVEGDGSRRILVTGCYALAAGEAIRLTVSTDPDATSVQLLNAVVGRVGPA